MSASPTAASLTAAEVQKIRNEFPYFADLAVVAGNPVAYLDSAATSQRPARVLNAERTFLEHNYGAVHRGTSSAVATTTEMFEQARAAVAGFVGARDANEIVWAAGATDAINMIALGMAEANTVLGGEPSSRFTLGAGDEILVTEAEHHANLIPWQRLCAKTGATLTYIPVNENGTWSLDDARNAITSRTRVVAFAHVSNVTGYEAPVAEVAELARSAGAITVLDACQSVPHLPVNFAELGVDFAVFSSHKMLGPNGIGVLYGRSELLDALPPARTGGSAITKVTLHEADFMPAPYKFEAGTQPVSQAVALAEAIAYQEEIGMHRAAQREHELVARLTDRLLSTPGLRLLGPQGIEGRVALAAVAVENLHAHDVGQYLDEQGIIVRVGHHCAQPLHRALGMASSTRASVHITTTEEEIDRFIEGLVGAQRYFNTKGA